MRLRIRTSAFALAAAVTLGGCTTYDDGYGYGSLSIGYGGGGWCDPYWDDCYGSGWYGDPWWGWYDDFYYPGIGLFVYDSWGRPFRWSDRHRRFWEGRRHHWSGRDWNDRRWERWDGFRDRRRREFGGRRDFDRRRGDDDGRRWRRRD